MPASWRSDGRRCSQVASRGGAANPSLGQPDRRLEQVGPGQLAVLPVRQLQQGDGAGHADREARPTASRKRQRLAVAAQEQLGRRAGRRGLAAVVGDHGAGRAVEMQQEAAAADARGLRLDDAQHHLHGDRRIDRRAAAAQDVEPGLGGQRVGRRDHRPGCRLGRRSEAQQQERPDDQAAADHARRATMNRRRKGKSVMPSGRAG